MMKSLSKAPNIVSSLKNKVKFPNRFQGTMFKKWAEYWKNLFADYRQMLQDLRTDIQDDPMKAMKWTAGLGTLCLLSMKNPDELDFKDYLKRINNETVMLSPDCLNPKTVEHLSYLDTCYNQGTIHYKSLGIFSLMYTTDLNESCDLYKAKCSYLQPTYVSLPSKIIDVGIMGQWWNLYIKTHNYDVN
ncbi:mitochondrial import inner membrane translocase subunit Tim29 [Spodoptera frugiperda]|uniref:Mitochondrial import inner membrane translocase subunit Tim29 n=1 Tax=Spodoptera frugiperda TaxID=7108 RepID=A0A9R0END5_SPOFR|nr:mitochondrial import inner membrane translocase subunit Tim29 [Spodoptera frugiperda]